MENERFERQNVEMAASSSNMLQFQGKRAEEHIQKKTEKHNSQNNSGPIFVV